MIALEDNPALVLLLCLWQLIVFDDRNLEETAKVNCLFLGASTSDHNIVLFDQIF